MRKKILVSAYAVSPYKGSEFSAAWNTIINLAQQHDLWVLYGASDDHMGDTQTLKEYLKHQEIPGVKFIKVKPGKLANSINKLNKVGLIWFFYLAFYLWQKRALAVAQQLLLTVDFDLIHQLGPIGFREPGFLWKINKPFVWGPIGGTSQVDARLLKNKSLKAKAIFSIKNIITGYQLKYAHRVNKAMMRANVLIGARKVDVLSIEAASGRKAIYMSEQGILGSPCINSNKFKQINTRVDLVWSGWNDERKNLILLLEALSKVKQKNWRLNILGSGPLTDLLKNKSKELSISDNINWHGHLTRDEAISIMSNAHLHVITSIMEGNPAVLLEALSHSVPTLTLDHSGMADIITEQCGIKVSIDKHEVVVKDFVLALERVLATPAILKDLAYSAQQYAQNLTWENRLRTLNNIYDKAIEDWSVKQNFKYEGEVVFAN